MKLNKWSFINNKNSNVLWLPFLRGSIAGICLLHILSILPDFSLIFSSHPLIPADILEAAGSAFVPTIYKLTNWVSQIVPTNIDWVTYLVIFIYVIALVLLFIGINSKWPAIISLLFQLIITNSISFYNYGVDTFCTIALFYCVVFPVQKGYGYKQILWHQDLPKINSNKYLWILQSHVCIIYFSSGFEKLLGINWRNGESIWKMVHSYQITNLINFDQLANTPFFLIIGWGTIILEMFYPLFINLKKTRKFWLGATIIFHTTIALFMGLYFFSSVMILLNLSSYYIPFLSNKIRPNSNLPNG